MTIGPNTIHDAHPAGPLTVEQVIQKSSNVGAAKIALQLPPATLWKMFSRGGLRHAARDRLPRRGVRAPARGEDVEADRAGDDVVRARPVGEPRADGARLHDLRERRRAQARHAAEDRRAASAGRPVIKPETARAVRHMLELATQPGGTAPKAQVPGYRVGGKTGTAHKNEGGAVHARVRVVVRGLRAGVEPAPHRRGDARRTRRPATTTAAASRRRCSRR